VARAAARGQPQGTPHPAAEYVEDYDRLRQLPREFATSGERGGGLMAVVLWPLITIRNFFATRRQTRLIDEVMALLQAESSPP
jgi:hypothetical protein